MTVVPTPGGGRRGATSAPRVGRRAYLEDVVRELFTTSSGLSPAGRSLVLLPRAGRPALAVPRRPRRAAAGAVRLYKSSAGRLTRLGLEALALLLRLGAVDLLPRLTVADGRRPRATGGGAGTGAGAAPGAGGPREQEAEGEQEPEEQADRDEDVVEALSRALGRPVLVAVYTSAPRANRKPVLHVLDPDGRALGFVKVGDTPLTSRLVRWEAQALSAPLAPGSTVLRPGVLLLERWRGLDLLMVEPVPFASGRLRPQTLELAMVELARSQGTVRQPLATGPYAAALSDRVASLPPGDAATALAEQLERALAVSAGLEVETGCWHGDWTPWNCAQSGDRLALWDWERFAEGVPLGFDRLHFRLQEDVVRRRHAPRDAALAVLAEAPALLAPFGLDAAAARVVARLYLLEIGSRYVQDLQDRVGGRLGDVASWLVPALRQQPAPEDAA